MQKRREIFLVICRLSLFARLVFILFNTGLLILAALWFADAKPGGALISTLFLAWTDFEFFLNCATELYISPKHIELHIFHRIIPVEWQEIKQVKSTHFGQRTLISLEKPFFPGNIAGILHNRFQPTVILSSSVHTNYREAVQLLKAKAGSKYHEASTPW